MKRKLSMLLAIAMLFCFVLSGCGEQAEDPVDSSAPSESGDAADGSFKIGYITSDPSDGFWKEVLESFTAACEEQGVEMIYQIAEDSAGMRSAYDSLITQQVDIIVDGYSIEEVANAYAEELSSPECPSWPLRSTARRRCLQLRHFQ